MLRMGNRMEADEPGEIIIKNINSISELLENLKRDTNPEEIYWYRGHSKANWKLIASLVRKRLGDLNKESEIISRFRQNASLLLSDRPPDELHWLTIMQHYTVPTRLLDWTESPLFGLYFSVIDHLNFDGALWVLKPVALNQLSHINPDNPKYIPTFDDEILRNYYPSSLASEKVTRLKPIAVIGPRNTARMQAQLGVFTVMHRDTTPVEDLGDKSHIFRYKIPSQAKRRIEQELNVLKIDKFQLFPELQSLGEILRIR